MPNSGIVASQSKGLIGDQSKGLNVHDVLKYYNVCVKYNNVCLVIIHRH